MSQSSKFLGDGKRPFLARPRDGSGRTFVYTPDARKRVEVNSSMPLTRHDFGLKCYFHHPLLLKAGPSGNEKVPETEAMVIYQSPGSAEPSNAGFGLPYHQTPPPFPPNGRLGNSSSWGRPQWAATGHNDSPFDQYDPGVQPYDSFGGHSSVQANPPFYISNPPQFPDRSSYFSHHQGIDPRRSFDHQSSVQPDRLYESRGWGDQTQVPLTRESQSHRGDFDREFFRRPTMPRPPRAPTPPNRTPSPQFGDYSNEEGDCVTLREDDDDSGTYGDRSDRY